MPKMRAEPPVETQLRALMVVDDTDLTTFTKAGYQLVAVLDRDRFLIGLYGQQALEQSAERIELLEQQLAKACAALESAQKRAVAAEREARENAEEASELAKNMATYRGMRERAEERARAAEEQLADANETIFSLKEALAETIAKGRT